MADAEVVLVEKKNDGGLFSPSSTCEEIAIANTDKNGMCFFDKERLRKSDKYDYFCAIKKSWNKEQSYPCTGKTSGFIQTGKNQDILVIDDLEGSFYIQYNNLFNTSSLGDSLIVIPKRLEFPNPKGGIVGGGGVSGGGIYASTGTNNYPSTFTGQLNKLSGIIVLNIRKRKFGVLSLISDTIKVLPNQTTIANVNW